VSNRVLPFPRDRFFAELDGRHLVVAGIDWSLQVYGICEQQGRRWVQLALSGAGEACMLTLRVAPRAGVADVLSTLSSWLTDPDDKAQQVLSVA
jgi:hypothetical protein